MVTLEHRDWRHQWCAASDDRLGRSGTLESHARLVFVRDPVHVANAAFLRVGVDLSQGLRSGGNENDLRRGSEWTTRLPPGVYLDCAAGGGERDADIARI